MDKITKLWNEMEEDLRKKDPHDDWPTKRIVMIEPYCLRIVSLHEGFEEHETYLDFVRQKAIRKEDFDESSIPADLLEYVKKYEEYDDECYPNVIEAIAEGDTLEEAIADMRKKLRLLDCGYILMDDYFYRREILDEDNGGWMLEEDDGWGFDDDDEESDDEEEPDLLK